jgi:hypothetical protein
MVYTMNIPRMSCLTVNHAFSVLFSSFPEMPCCVHVFPFHPTLIAALKAVKTERSVNLVYVWHIPFIYLVYVIYIQGIINMIF